MASQRHFNTFQRGMVGDLDPHMTPEGTYRYARNLRLLYNSGRSGAGTEGRSLALEPMQGTLEALTITAGYTPIGSAQTEMGLVIFSHNGQDSEIGLMRETTTPASPVSQFSYEPLFNDQYDPNTQRLALFRALHFQAEVITENKKVLRVYWVDGVHSLRVLNLHLCLDSAGVAFHRNRPYPKHLSVHQMEAQPSLRWGMLKFRERIVGELLSGMYQFTYRYVSRDGHPSPYYPLSRPIPVMDQPISRLDNNKQNHHRRYMGTVGIQTEEGIRLTLSELDTRWDELELVAVYHAADAGAERAVRVKVVPVDSGELTLDVPFFRGESVTMSDLLTRNQSIIRDQTIASFGQHLYRGGVELQPELILTTNEVQTSFCTHGFTADETFEPLFKSTPNPDNPARNDGDKLTNSTLRTTILRKVLYRRKSGAFCTDEYVVDGDYVNFKGQQVCQQFMGYRRGETYGFAALCLDDKGEYYFAQPLGDITMPDWNDAPVTSFNTETSRWEIRQLGVVFDNIRIPRSVALYPDGKLRLSGIMIVRTEASGKLGAQGVIFPCTSNHGGLDASAKPDDNKDKIEPMVSWNNLFEKSYLEGAHRSPHVSKVTGDSGGTKNEDIAGKTFSAPYYVTLHAPDFLIDGTIGQASERHLQLCGTAHKAYDKNEIQLEIDRSGSTYNSTNHYYTKNYRTDTFTLPGGDAVGRPRWGEKTRLRFWMRHDTLDRDKKYKTETTDAGVSTLFDPDNAKAWFDPIQSAFLGRPQSAPAFNGSLQDPYRGLADYADAILQPGSIICKLRDWESVDVARGVDSYVSCHVVNELKPGSLPGEDTRIYIPTGYMLPITEAVLADLPQDKGDYILGGMEVYGGDTIVNLFDFCKLYPLWDNDCARRRKYTTDYGVGHIVPIESTHNLALRSGRSLANNGMYAQRAGCEGEALHTTGGIAWGAAEDWNIASCLRPKETIALYKSKPRSVNTESSRPNTIYVSQAKTYGELHDSYRQWRPLDYKDTDGTKGTLIRLEQTLNGVYAWQEWDYARLRAQERAQVATTTGALTLGTGGPLDGLDYYGDVGLQTFSALLKDGDRVYWIDEAQKLLCRISQAGLDLLSEKKQGHDRLVRQLAVKGAWNYRMGLLPVDGDLLITYQRGRNHDTLLYNEKLDAFTGTTDLCARLYMRYRGRLLGAHPSNPHVLHWVGEGEALTFWGERKPFTLQYIAAPAPTISKKFDNLLLSLSPDGLEWLTTINGQTQHRTLDGAIADISHTLTPQNDSRVRYWDGRLMLPLMEADGNELRLQGQYLTLTLTGNFHPVGRCTIWGSETIWRVVHNV